MPPNPPSNAHGFDMQIPKSEKKILAPPLPNPVDAPVKSCKKQTYYNEVCHTCRRTNKESVLSADVGPPETNIFKKIQ